MTPPPPIQSRIEKGGGPAGLRLSSPRHAFAPPASCEFCFARLTALDITALHLPTALAPGLSARRTSFGGSRSRIPDNKKPAGVGGLRAFVKGFHKDSFALIYTRLPGRQPEQTLRSCESLHTTHHHVKFFLAHPQKQAGRSGTPAYPISQDKWGGSGRGKILPRES